MKRAGFLFEKVVSYENILLAIINTTRKRKYQRFRKRFLGDNKDKYISEIQNLLIEGNYVPAIPEETRRFEPRSQKWRTISKVPVFPDQIIHHALMQVTIPLLKRGMDCYCSANVKGRGNHYAKQAVEKFVRKDIKNTKYCLKMDIKQFYPSIRQDLMKKKLRRIIKDAKVIEIFDKIIDSGKSGLPIGLYTSQWLANFYLQSLDHFIKEKLHASYMVRFADDIVILGSNKRKLRRSKQAIDEFFELQIKPSWRLFKVDKDSAIDFVGFKIYRFKTAIRKRIWLPIRRTILKIINSLSRRIAPKEALIRRFFSYYGYIKHSNHYRISYRYLSRIDFDALKAALN